MQFFALLLMLVTSANVASAASCSEFDQNAAVLLEQARQFQETDRFIDYGWSKAGPTNGWLQKFKDSRHNDAELKFFRKFEVSFADIYMVADTFRTDGQLDSFWTDVNEKLSGVLVCK